FSTQYEGPSHGMDRRTGREPGEPRLGVAAERAAGTGVHRLLETHLVGWLCNWAVALDIAQHRHPCPTIGCGRTGLHAGQLSQCALILAEKPTLLLAEGRLSLFARALQTGEGVAAQDVMPQHRHCEGVDAVRAAEVRLLFEWINAIPPLRVDAAAAFNWFDLQI